MANRSEWFDLKASEYFGYQTAGGRSEGPNMIGILGQHHQLTPQDPTLMKVNYGDRIDGVSLHYGDKSLGGLGKFGGKKTIEIDLVNNSLARIEFWGAHPKGDPPRLGRMVITMDDGTVHECGSTQNEYLGVLEVTPDMQLGALFGFSGEELNGLGLMMKHPVDAFYVNWMELGLNTDAQRSRPLNSICLPASHDTGTYALSDVLTDDPSAELARAMEILDDIESVFDKAGIGRLLSWASVRSTVMASLDDLSTTTTRTVYDQLLNGIRCLDLRVFYGKGPASDTEDKFYLFHGLVGPTLETVLSDLSSYARAYVGEIFYVTFGHLQNQSESTDGEVMRLLREQISESLGDLAYKKTGSNNSSLFSQTYEAITAEARQQNASTIILVDGESNIPSSPSSDLAYNPDIFWPRSYSPADNGNGRSNRIIGHYTETPDVNEMLAGQKALFDTYKISPSKADQGYALYFTLTPSFDQYVGIVGNKAIRKVQKVVAATLASPFKLPLWPIAAAISIIALEQVRKYKLESPGFSSLEELSQKVNRQMYELATENFQAMRSQELNQIGFLYSDFYEQTETVAIAVSYTLANGPHVDAMIAAAELKEDAEMDA